LFECMLVPKVIAGDGESTDDLLRRQNTASMH
jgi:hypothetical protein